MLVLKLLYDVLVLELVEEWSEHCVDFGVESDERGVSFSAI